MGAGLKKDLRVSRVGPGGSLNAFFFLPIGVISQGLVMVREKGEQAHLKSVVQRRVLDSPEPQESLEWDSNSAPFEILRRVALCLIYDGR
ncbi:hypothetical protein MUK42_15648 [Musa troglodytarum]|uniref:Uncharacterized protein n=1 Tax=Musa troglodytarum TaxID=320322 RepID=A0A9E7F6J6_9LILI|nr:hypothetical protein MUK42_15648 [Musa troglodytarum]